MPSSQTATLSRIPWCPVVEANLNVRLLRWAYPNGTAGKPGGSICREVFFQVSTIRNSTEEVEVTTNP